MKKVICDICEEESSPSKTLSIEFLDGEHPHNGSTMFKNADVCIKCALKLKDLQVRTEFDEIKKEICKNI